MFLTVGTPERLKDIETRSWSVGKARRFVPIVIVDDEGFALSDVLREHGFDITEWPDVTSISALAAHDILVCDIKGVGRSFGGKYEGGHIIREARRLYPEKYIIAFSGRRFDPSFKRVLDDADVSIKKDADVEEWVELLDDAVQNVGNPVSRWKRVRSILLNHGVELYEVLKLEQAYIAAVKTGDFKSMTKAARELPTIQGAGDILQVTDRLVGFASKIATIAGAL